MPKFKEIEIVGGKGAKWDIYRASDDFPLGTIERTGDILYFNSAPASSFSAAILLDIHYFMDQQTGILDRANYGAGLDKK